MVHVKCKTFDLYLKELIYYPRRAPKWLSDNRLTSQEKKILQSYLLIRSNQSQKVIEDLKGLQESDIDFVRDHWNLLLGICYNNIGEHAESHKYLKTVVQSFEAEENYYHLFTALFNLFIVESNIGKVDAMGVTLKRMEALNPTELLGRIRLLRCQFIYACDSNNIEMAHALIKKIKNQKSKFSESDLAQHLVCEFMFHMKQEDLGQAEKTLSEIKKVRNYSVSENFIFMARLLAHLKNDDPLYVYQREFATTSFLFYQMKVIEALQSKDEEQANFYWNKLRDKDPHLYGNDFNYAGEKCLFSLCLNKHLSESAALVSFNVQKDNALHARLFQILTQAITPLNKAFIYELLWEETPESKEDFIKLSKLISKVRSLYSVEIVSRKGTYFIQKDQSQSHKNIA